jgi:hypothetical protein
MTAAQHCIVTGRDTRDVLLSCRRCLGIESPVRALSAREMCSGGTNQFFAGYCFLLHLILTLFSYVRITLDTSLRRAAPPAVESVAAVV